jgi:hypothetical protein
MRVDKGNNSQNTVSVRRSVYDGQERIGDFQQCDTGVTARGKRGEVLGVFATEADAINAIALVAKGERTRTLEQAYGEAFRKICDLAFPQLREGGSGHVRRKKNKGGRS